jgi:predicted dehydrogenase
VNKDLNMTDKIRLGLIGASVKGSWSSKAHLPALRAHPDVELVAVSTTKADSAEAARSAWGARLAFDDYREMVASPDIDAVAVVVRVPSHYAPAKAALEAGKHVYCEWPLGRTTAEAVELTSLARTKGLVTAAGLQARAHSALLHMKELVAGGFVGEVTAVHVDLLRDGILSRPASRMWQKDAEAGANTLTIPAGHTLDAARFVVGELDRLSAVVATKTKQWLDTDTNKLSDATSPDNVLLSGHLANGAVLSFHVATLPYAGSGYRFEVYGTKGTLVASGHESPQMGEIFLHGASGGNKLEPIAVAPDSGQLPLEAINVARMYRFFAAAIRGGENRQPTFETAVELHRLLDAAKQASDTGHEIVVRP